VPGVEPGGRSIQVTGLLAFSEATFASHLQPDRGMCPFTVNVTMRVHHAAPAIRTPLPPTAYA